MKTCSQERGISLVEVLVAMVIGSVAAMGTFEAVQSATRSVQQGMMKTRALTLVQNRLEAKRSVRWESLLQDDLDHDGLVDRRMQDDGLAPDVVAGDGQYTAQWEQDGVQLLWILSMDRPGALNEAGLVTIRATASYQGVNGMIDVQMVTLLANPRFVGVR